MTLRNTHVATIVLLGLLTVGAAPASAQIGACCSPNGSCQVVERGLCFGVFLAGST